jgi:hypothetical protein
VEKFTSRKFLLALLYTGIVVLMKWFGKLEDDTFAQLFIAFFAIYCGANVTSKFTKWQRK